MVFACEDDDIKNGNGDICYITKELDEAGLLTREYIYSSDNKLERTNEYDEGILAVYSTMEYTADKITRINDFEDNTIRGYEEISWTGNEISNIKIYGINDENVMELWATQVCTYTSGKLSSISTTTVEGNEVELIYTWSGNNIEKIKQSFQNEIFTITYQYDDKKNIYNGFSSYSPYAMMSPSMSENNITLATETNENGDISRIETSTYTYNATGYPITVTEVNNEIGDQTETNISSFEYNCK